MSIKEEQRKNSRFWGMIKHWARYVDHTLIVRFGTDRQVDLFLKGTNEVHSEKGNKTINYLNLTITVNSVGVRYKNYRQPTCTDIIVPEHSFHHPKPEMAALENYCLRAITFQLEDGIEKWFLSAAIVRLLSFSYIPSFEVNLAHFSSPCLV